MLSVSWEVLAQPFGQLIKFISGEAENLENPQHVPMKLGSLQIHFVLCFAAINKDYGAGASLEEALGIVRFGEENGLFLLTPQLSLLLINRVNAVSS